MNISKSFLSKVRFKTFMQAAKSLKTKKQAPAEMFIEGISKRFKGPKSKFSLSGHDSHGVYVDFIKGLTQNEIHLEQIRSPKIGAGYGTEAMKFIVSVADKTGTTITLVAAPLDDEGENEDIWSQEKLADWYGSFGFDGEYGEEEMVRHPKKIKSTKE